jgi:hypothetical protein
VKGGSQRVKSVFYPKREEAKPDGGAAPATKKDEKKPGVCG